MCRAGRQGGCLAGSRTRQDAQGGTVVGHGLPLLVVEIFEKSEHLFDYTKAS